ncbi:MAG: hypothetical protein KIS66_18075, partial [Fimbriimonadaceae bacterium]|nr:hypothetical protein [Fimbriimonadaceae bacterium]
MQAGRFVLLVCLLTPVVAPGTSDTSSQVRVDDATIVAKIVQGKVYLPLDSCARALGWSVSKGPAAIVRTRPAIPPLRTWKGVLPPEDVRAWRREVETFVVRFARENDKALEPLLDSDSRTVREHARKLRMGEDYVDVVAEAYEALVVAPYDLRATTNLTSILEYVKTHIEGWSFFQLTDEQDRSAVLRRLPANEVALAEAGALLRRTLVHEISLRAW